jgi:hypothetical protein
MRTHRIVKMIAAGAIALALVMMSPAVAAGQSSLLQTVARLPFDLIQKIISGGRILARLLTASGLVAAL